MVMAMSRMVPLDPLQLAAFLSDDFDKSLVWGNWIGDVCEGKKI